MPYFITQENADCSGWAVMAVDSDEVFGCHTTKQSAIDQAVAISLAEQVEFLGERNESGPQVVVTDIDGTIFIDGNKTNENLLAYLDSFPDTSIFVVTGRLEEDRERTSNELTDAGVRFDDLIMRPDESLTSNEFKAETAVRLMETYNVMIAVDNDEGARAAYRAAGITALHPNEVPASRAEAEPAPPEDQVTGSDENKPGSAQGPGGDVEFSAATETALRNKVTEHNDNMAEDNKPDYTRTTFGQLATVYRRGSGAYSVSHRPGVSRAAWSMARVNAYLYLLRNGRPENANYIGDNDLLPEGHPRSSRSLEARAVDLSPPAYMVDAARKGLEWFAEGLAGDGLQDSTVRAAREMVAGRVSEDKWRKIAAWISRHLVDLDSPDANPSSDNYPSPGVVAHALWGSDGGKAGARRVLSYAEDIIGRIEAENTNRSKERTVSKIETRIFANDFEVRETSDGMTLTGYAARFNEPSEPLPFVERIQRGAFKRSLSSRNNIYMLWNHSSSDVLASTRAGSLRLSEDEYGLRVEADLPDTQLGRDAKVLIQRGDVTGFSFGFTVPANGDSWNADGTERTLKSVRLLEVSAGVAFPAYPSTVGSAQVRSLEDVVSAVGVDYDALTMVLNKVAAGEPITYAEKEVMELVLDALVPEEDVQADPEMMPEDEPVTEENGLDMLALKRKRLALMLLETL
jgi:HK97 family phage prohead protease